ncbi:MAG: phosphomannomutase/phosphoglucomutase [Acidimicrobiia bacterium]|nr:phosphomannomutase/phosphoglucomutase [Acidimicrobiia bacterium]
MASLESIFKAYDVRGTYPDQIDAAVCRAIGSAFGRFVREAEPASARVVVGHDMRPSGPELASAFADGVAHQGLDVVDIGLVSTDMMYFAAGSLDAPGAVFTASHNPARYNGIKMCLSQARPIGADTGLDRIKELAADPPADGPAGARTRADLLDDFVRHVHSFVDTSSFKPLRIVADTANGMGGLVVPRVFAGLPFELEILYPELDGTFPNHPADPIQPENLRDLQARVLEVGADLGLAFDGDADRVFLVDEHAEPISGSLTTAIVAGGLLDRHPGATVIHNLICSKAVPEVVRERGGTPVRTRVGHSFIKAVMADHDALFGGEHSGHYYFRDNWRADSGLIATMVVLEQLCRAGVPMSELKQPFDRYAASGEINTVVDDQAAVLEAVAAHYSSAAQDRLDGLTVDCGEWWFNLRPSNTEPLLRLNLEAPTAAQVAERVAEVQAAMGGR